MKNCCLVFCLLINFIGGFSQVNLTKGKDLPGKWSQLKYDKVVVYKTKIVYTIRKGKSIPDSLIDKEVILSKAQIDSLNSFLFNTATYGELITFFNGGLKTGEYVIEFYTNSDNIAFITLFLESNTLRGNYEIPAMS